MIEWSNVEWLGFRNLKITNIKITKDELFHFYFLITYGVCKKRKYCFIYEFILLFLEMKLESSRNLLIFNFEYDKISEI